MLDNLENELEDLVFSLAIGNLLIVRDGQRV